MKSLIGKKIGMTQIFKEEKLIPATLVQAGPCSVAGLRTVDKNGYNAVILGFEDVKEEKINKPESGYFKKIKVGPKRHLSEIRTDNVGDFKINQELNIDMFNIGEKISATAISKGKGFAGAMKKWNFAGSKASHGAHRVHRKIGSIGASASPSRVFPGKKMPGQMGNVRKTIKNLEIIEINNDNNILAIKGAIPGGHGSIVLIKGSN